MRISSLSKSEKETSTRKNGRETDGGETNAAVACSPLGWQRECAAPNQTALQKPAQSRKSKWHAARDRRWPGHCWPQVCTSPAEIIMLFVALDTITLILALIRGLCQYLFAHKVTTFMTIEKAIARFILAYTCAFMNTLSILYRDQQSRTVLKPFQAPPRGEKEANFYTEVRSSSSHCAIYWLARKFYDTIGLSFGVRASLFPKKHAERVRIKLWAVFVCRHKSHHDFLVR